MNLIEDLKWRGLIKDISDEAKFLEWANSKGGAYIGCDPSFKSLHLGNYLSLTLVKRLMNAGHPVTCLIGGITGLIGDPKATVERVMQESEVIEHNIKCLTKQYKEFLNPDKIINNMKFYQDMDVASYLRDIGKLVNVNYMLEKDIIARRLETGISYAEFSYTLLQGYDFLKLYENENITCQFGGSDQWGNITTGLEMIRKVHGTDAKACCFSVPLLLKDDGTKFGKSEGGALYLDPEITPPYSIYNYLVNAKDNEIEKLLKQLTFLTKSEIENILSENDKDRSQRYAQKCLAQAVIGDLYGQDEVARCMTIASALFNNKIAELSHSDLFYALSGCKTYVCNEDSMKVVDIITDAGMVKNKAEARNIIEQGALVLNNEQIKDPTAVVTTAKSFINNKKPFSYIKKGKREYLLIIFG